MGNMQGEVKRGDQREKMPKGTAATERAQGGVEGWRQRPKRAAWRREAEGLTQRGDMQCIRHRERAERKETRGERGGTPRETTADSPNGAEKTEAVCIGALGALPTGENCLCRAAAGR